jgi:hypothetical protein
MPTRLLTVALMACALAPVLAACGGGDDGGAGEGDSAPAPSASEFPSPKGKSMMQLREGLGPGPVLAPTVAQLVPGRQRYAFALFTTARKQISGVPVALYVQRSGSTKTLGPFPARDMSLKVDPSYESENVARDPDAAKSLYVADIDFPKKPGTFAVMGVAKLDGRLVATDPIGARVLAKDPVPDIGDPAPPIDTPTTDDAAIEEIDTRTPPDDMHEVNFKDVVGEKPAVLLFATPALCQSRVCGPVVDIAEQVQAEAKGDVAFIHMEVYRDNTIKPGCLEGTRPEEQCLRPQVLAYKLQTEPWAFAVNADGKVAARLEGAYSKSELERAVKAASGG